MKKLVPALLVLAAIYLFGQYRDPAPDPPDVPAGALPASHGDPDALARAWEERARGRMVTGGGTVQRVLADDNDGIRHQRFVLELASGRTLLVAHNIDLAPRVDGLAVGDRVAFSGEYEWNERGGVIHWTHHDPQGRRAGGWLEHAGRRYD